MHQYGCVINAGGSTWGLQKTFMGLLDMDFRLYENENSLAQIENMNKMPDVKLLLL